MKNYQKFILVTKITISLMLTMSCGFGGIGGAGWDDKGDIETARKYPPTESGRILVTTEEVPYQTFRQEFDSVYQDFPFTGNPIGASTKASTTQIVNTPYSVSYENSVLKIFRDANVIVERKLPNIFYMHPVSSAALIGKSRAEDRILCRTYSRATTGLHYIFIADGNGDILFEKIIGASEDWDISPESSGEIIIGGAHTKTIISPRK